MTPYSLLLLLSLAAPADVPADDPPVLPLPCTPSEPGSTGHLVRCHPNGARAEEGDLVDGNWRGTFRTWSDNGQMQSQIEYDASSAFALWARDGENILEGRIASDPKTNDRSFVYECPDHLKPVTRRIMMFGMGSGDPPFITWCADRVTRRRTRTRPYRFGYMFGLNEWFPAEFRDGHAVVLSPSLVPLYAIDFRGGKPHGRFVSWYPNGQKNEEGRFLHGKKTGQWRKWSETGVLTEVTR